MLKRVCFLIIIRIILILLLFLSSRLLAFSRRKAHKYWQNTPNLFLLGDTEVERLPIFPFVIFHKESGKLLHHNFVCAVLNDVFGIQARAGCACAGPYAEVRE